MAAPVMARGFGLPEVIAALVPELDRLGVQTEVACQTTDGLFGGFPIHAEVEPTAESVLALARRVRADAVVAHGSPFFEVLPDLRGKLLTVAYEHGEPPAVLFDDVEERARREQYRREHVYGHVDRVVAISEFIRDEIGWPSAFVIPNGVDHIPDQGTKAWLPPRDPGQPLRVGLLMRLGQGESRYKGNDLLPQLRTAADDIGVQARWEVMGRGSDHDGWLLTSKGFAVHLNATNEERERYLRDIDVFVTLSKWEGCNLPLLEAQALGTPALAPDTGAHPEFTPLCFSSLPAMAQQLRAYAHDPVLLRTHGDMCYRQARARTWSDAAADLVRVMDTGAHHRRRRLSEVREALREKVDIARSLYQEEGPGSVARVAVRKVTGGGADDD